MPEVETRAPVQLWEYKVEFVKQNEMAQRLNELGGESWELVYMHPIPQRLQYQLVLKRELKYSPPV